MTQKNETPEQPAEDDFYDGDVPLDIDVAKPDFDAEEMNKKEEKA